MGKVLSCFVLVILSQTLTHCGLVMPYGDKDLGQHWLRQGPVAWWHQAITWINVDIIKGVLWHSPESNFTRGVDDINLWRLFKDYTFEIMTTSPRGQWVNFIETEMLWWNFRHWHCTLSKWQHPMQLVRKIHQPDISVSVYKTEHFIIFTLQKS